MTPDRVLFEYNLDIAARWWSIGLDDPPTAVSAKLLQRSSELPRF